MPCEPVVGYLLYWGSPGAKRATAGSTVISRIIRHDHSPGALDGFAGVRVHVEAREIAARDIQANPCPLAKTLAVG